MSKKYDFFKTKYGYELLIDLIRLESLEKYIINDTSHYLTYYDITLILEGDGFFLIDGNKFDICRNQIFFSSQNQIRKWEIEKAPKGLVLIFEEEFLCAFFNDAEFVQKLSYFNNVMNPPSIRITDENNEYLVNILENIEKEIISNKDNHILRALLYQALAWLDHKYRSIYAITENKQPSNYVLKFVKLVNKNFQEYHSVNYYAGKLCITPGHLNELLKKHYGITAKQYIQNRIMLEAKRLLSFSNLPVSEIAWKLNFDDTSYFVRLFRKLNGKTPLAYRKKQNP